MAPTEPTGETRLTRAAPTPSPTPEAPARSLWHHPDFVKLWAGETVSILGTRFSGLALQLIAVVTLQATAGQMGLLAALDTAPVLLIGLFAGVWVDRRSRRPFLIASDVGRAALLATIPIAALAGVVSLPQLYAVTLMVGVLTVFFDVAYRSYLPSLVSSSQLVEGNSKLELSRSAASVAGLSLSGVVVQAVTAPVAVLLDSLSYVASAACLCLIRGREERREPVSGSVLADVRDGVGLVVRHPWLRATAACTATSTLFSCMFFALYTLFGTRDLRLQATQLGLIYGIGAVGAIVGPIAAGPLASRFGVGRTLVGAALVGALEVVPAVFATPGSAVAMLIASSLIGNLGWTIYNVNAIALRQAATPTNLQGRMNATMHFATAGMTPLGGLLGGLVGQALGLRAAIAIGAAGSALSFLWVLMSPLPRVKRLPEAAGQPAAGGSP